MFTRRGSDEVEILKPESGRVRWALPSPPLSAQAKAAGETRIPVEDTGLAPSEKNVFCLTKTRRIMGGLKEIFFDYALWTSTHGIPHVARVHTNRARVFWTVTFLASCTMLGFQVSKVVARYLKYEKTTSFRLEVENQKFPAVTVCALNPFKKSAALHVDGIKDLLAAFSTATGGAAAFQKTAVQTNSRQKRQAPTEIAPQPHRTYPCACDSSGRSCSVVYGPNSATDRICVCSRAGEFCELCTEDIDSCVLTWGTLETARPCVCHSYSEECVEVTTGATGVCLCNRVLGTCRPMVEGSTELMRACRCETESCVEVTKPDSSKDDICMCNTDSGLCRKCFDSNCEEYRIVVMPCLCTSPHSCSSFGQWEIVERHHLCYCRLYSRDRCTPCQSEECLERFSVGWVGKAIDHSTPAPLTSLAPSVDSDSTMPTDEAGNSTSTAASPVFGLEFAVPGACNCTQGLRVKRCSWIDDPQYLPYEHLQLLEGCICDATERFCLPCNISICTVMFERRIEATTQMPTTRVTTQAPIQTTEKPAFGFKDDNKDQIANQAKAENALQFLAAGLNTTMRKVIGYQIDELILQCAYNTQSCDLEEDFEEIQDPNYGNCYAFKPAQESDRSGPVYGLQLILFTDLREYLVTSKMAGARVVIGDSEEYPFPDSTGYNAPVGSAVSFGIRKKKTTRLPKPYGDCVNDKSEADQAYFYDGIYTVEGCARSCLQQNLISKCGCADPRYPKGFRPEPFCRDETQRACINEAQKTRSVDSTGKVLKCDCPLSCEETRFDVTISSSFWPLNGVTISGCDEAGILEEFNDTCANVYREMGVMVQVYFEQLNQQITYETPAFAEDALLADIASQVGFWIGVSVVSMVEFGVLMCKVLLHIATDAGSGEGQDSWSQEKDGENKPKNMGRLRALALSVARFSVSPDEEKEDLEILRRQSVSKDIELGLSRRRSQYPHPVSPPRTAGSESDRAHWERLREERGHRRSSLAVASAVRRHPPPLEKQDTLPLSLNDI